MDQQNFNQEEDWGSDQAEVTSGGKVKKPGMSLFSIIALCCAVASFFVNPCSLVWIAALVFAVLGIAKADGKNAVLSYVTFGVCVLEIICDVVLAIFSFGATLLV